jgi:lactate dehydrogenase-like 2-hydroxyacid dehydrogenase
MMNLGTLFVKMNLGLPLLATSRDHQVRVQAIVRGIASGKLSAPVLARQIIDRALAGAQINTAVLNEYRASFAELPQRLQREFLPRLASAIKKEMTDAEIEVSENRLKTAQDILVGLGLSTLSH